MNTNLSKNSAVFLAAVLVAGTISMIVPSSFAQEYYPQDPYAKDPYAKDPYAKDPYVADPYVADPYAKDPKKSASVNIQKIKCINENLNVNGIQITTIPEPGIAAAEAQAEDAGAANGNGLLGGDGINFDKNLVNVCVNVNVNDQVDVNEEVPPFDPQDCDDCFTTTNVGGPIPPGLLTMLNNYLANNDVTVGQATERVNNVQGLCDLIDAQNTAGTPGTEQQIRNILNAAFPGNSNPVVIDRIIDCLLGIGVIVADGD